MELRNEVYQNEDLRRKPIPYLFFTTSAEQKSVIDADSKSIRGFFKKPTEYEALKNAKLYKIVVTEYCENLNKR